MRARLAILLTLGPLATAAHGAEANCDTATTPVEEAACAFDLAGSKTRLNAAYGVLAKKIGPDALPLLEKAQKAWLGFRNAHCDYQADLVGSGSMASSERVACTATLNLRRAEELEADAKRIP